jgi:hypothetical protein
VPRTRPRGAAPRTPTGQAPEREVALVIDVWSAADHGHKSKAFDVVIKRLVPEAIATFDQTRVHAGRRAVGAKHPVSVRKLQRLAAETIARGAEIKKCAAGAAAKG